MHLSISITSDISAHISPSVNDAFSRHERVEKPNVKSCCALLDGKPNVRRPGIKSRHWIEETIALIAFTPHERRFFAFLISSFPFGDPDRSCDRRVHRAIHSSFYVINCPRKQETKRKKEKKKKVEKKIFVKRHRESNAMKIGSWKFTKEFLNYACVSRVFRSSLRATLTKVGKRR